MRKIYDEYFRVPEEGKGVVREKVFFTRLMVSVVCMAICMIAMGYNAYAYFTFNVESTINTIQASTYSLDVSATTTQPGHGTVTQDAETGKYTLSPGQYEFKLTKNGTATTGYCRIDVDEVIENGNTYFKTSYYTQQIGKVIGSEEPIDERSIIISVDKDTIIQFVGCWGTYAGAESNASTFLDDDEIIQVQDGTIAKGNVSDLGVASVAESEEEEEPVQGSDEDVSQEDEVPAQEKDEEVINGENEITDNIPESEEESDGTSGDIVETQPVTESP